MYADKVKTDANGRRTLTLPGAGWNGQDLVLTPDVGLIEDASTLK